MYGLFSTHTQITDDETPNKGLTCNIFMNIIDRMSSEHTLPLLSENSVWC